MKQTQMNNVIIVSMMAKQHTMQCTANLKQQLFIIGAIC